ncbi:molybdenum ABC transporter substrate-binding protein [Burkholderia multivorans]|uniref:substrate-binding domain-containing protein n=1 Tax=Burkholderia multivorans TaxID=87883 RepID=UPI0006C794CA|nr:substrate-binding domain-containing protein [Burkholderia multivorans]KPJ35466.1 molybdenum ABC transporter substrate-binding protein [Burkholderia multivorans]
MAHAPRTPTAIAGISSMATRPLLARLVECYAYDTGGRVDVTSIGGVDAARRVQAGEPFDFVVLAADAIERLAAEGRVDIEGRVDVARSAIAVAVPAGTPRPDLGTEAAVRDAVLRARQIGYSTGPSGVHLNRLFARWGIADALASRIVQAPPGVPVGSLIASGDVELGFQQLSELTNVDGIDVAGLLPDTIQSITVFAAAVCTAAREPASAAQFLAYLASPHNDAAKRACGMEPA